MHITFKIFEVLRLPGCIDDDVGAVKRLPLPDRHRQKIQALAELDIGVAANPSGIDLPSQQQRGDFLVRAASYELHVAPPRAREVGSQTA